MKNLAFISFALLLIMVVVEACQKGLQQQPLELVASKTTVKYNEPDTLILLGAQNDSVTWSVSPSDSIGIYKKANKARIVFAKAGTYTVSATDPGHAPLTKIITVLNENFIPPPVTTNPPPPVHDTTVNVPITGNIIITPALFKLPNTDSTGFILSAQTDQANICNSIVLNTSQSQVGNNFVANFINFIEPSGANCLVISTKTLSTRFIFYPQVSAPIILGNAYPLTITVSGTTYTGSVIFNKTYMDITWNYTSGVTFSTKHVSL